MPSTRDHFAETTSPPTATDGASPPPPAHPDGDDRSPAQSIPVDLFCNVNDQLCIAILNIGVVLERLATDPHKRCLDEAQAAIQQAAALLQSSFDPALLIALSSSPAAT